MWVRSLIAAAIALCAIAPAASAAVSQKKAIWGPVEVGGASQFPTYSDLGAGIYQTDLSWAAVAPTRPGDPRNPADPAYAWPAEIDAALAEADQHGMRVLVSITFAPGWANGGLDRRFAPRNPRLFADFAEAASRRYPGVDLWLIWGEPSKASNFQPLRPLELGRRVPRRGRAGPRRYARLLDASYARLKRVQRTDLVVGGNTFTAGEVPPLLFIRLMRLPNGRPPRMDLYGHNPFSVRKPALRRPPLRYGYSDFSDLDRLVRHLDRYQRRKGRPRLRLFLSEFTLPTDHENREFNFFLTREAQADWLAAALRITRRWSRIYSLGYLGLYDEPPNARGDEVNRGLLDHLGNPKPAYEAFKRG